MTVYIEKLKLENPHGLVYLTLCDFVLGTHGKGQYTYEDAPIRTDLIRNDIISSLEKHQIFLAKHYGLDGICIDKLINSDNLLDYYIEIPTGHIKYYNTVDLISLSKKNKIIFTDFEEGGSINVVWHDIYGQRKYSSFTKFLIESGINFKNVIFASSNFEKNKICKEIKMFQMWLLMQSLSVNYVQDIILNNNKQQYLDILSTKKYEKFAVFKNWRARRWRLVLLSILNDSKLLDKIDWSLIGEFGHRFFDDDSLDFKIENFIKTNNLEWLNNSKFKDQVIKFMDDHSHSLPKFLFDSDKINRHAHLYLDEFHLKRYMYSIDVDTANLMTEKPIKSFLQGSMPILIYPSVNSRYLEKIQSLGFKLLDTEFDKSTNIDELIISAGNKIQNLYNLNIEPKLDDILHNFELCTNKQQLVNYFVQPLIEAFK